MAQINLNNCNYVSEDDIKLILKNCNYNETYFLKDFHLFNASSKMLGFMSDYWRLHLYIQTDDGEMKTLCFFIKSLSRTNEAKASMAANMNVFEKEIKFYSIIKNKIDIPDMKPWSPKFIANLNNALVFEDLTVNQYKIRNIFHTFDEAHTRQALQTLARFHASSIIYEEKRSKELKQTYRIYDHYEKYLDEGGYKRSDPWIIQCMTSTLEIIKVYSKYSKNEELLEVVENNWENIWCNALRLSDYSLEYRNVICHRDLWNNNILFHYNVDSNPDDCVFVDYQAVRCQPPTGDVMALLYCNLDPKFRENNINRFLYYYYTELKALLHQHEIPIDNILSWKSFLKSSKEQRLWGLINSACLMPTQWVDADFTMKTFSDTNNFKDIFLKNKASFISNMILINDCYRTKIVPIFEEIVERYCLNNIIENIM